jgi:predicted DNA-binding WGR domain protein
MTTKRTFVLINEAENHKKFWAISQTYERVRLAWGRIGTAGQEKTLTFVGYCAAQKYAKARIAEKKAKGYVELQTERKAA